MAKVTSKLQVTLPKALADRYGIRPGDDIEWVAAGDSIRIVPSGRAVSPALDPTLRLKLFDAATERQRRRQARRKLPVARDRGWKREDLYRRGRAG